MSFLISSELYSAQYAGVGGGFYYFGSPSPFAQGLPTNTASAAATVGAWYGRGDGFGFSSGYGTSTGSYIPGWANRFFADRAPTQHPSGGYPPALEDRARDYVRKALGKEWMPDNKRYATGYDAYSTNQHADISRSEQAAGADGREKTVWELADSLKDWMENGDKRADYSAASDIIRKSTGSSNEKLAARVANLLVPGSSEVTKEAAESAMAHLKAAEMPTDRTPNAIMAAYIRKLGGETVAQSLVDEVSAQVASRGIPTKSEGDYIADLEKRGFHGPEAKAVYDKMLANKDDAGRREVLSRMGEVKTDKVDATEKAKQYDQNARVAAMQSLGVKNEEELRAMLEKYKGKSFSDFLVAMRRDVEAGTIPQAAAAGGGRGSRGRNPAPGPAPTPPVGTGPASSPVAPAPGAPSGPVAPAPAPAAAPVAPAVAAPPRNDDMKFVEIGQKKKRSEAVLADEETFYQDILRRFPAYADDLRTRGMIP